jgi:hypothetical protein
MSKYLLVKIFEENVTNDSAIAELILRSKDSDIEYSGKKAEQMKKYVEDLQSQYKANKIGPDLSDNFETMFNLSLKLSNNSRISASTPEIVSDKEKSDE